MTCQLTLVFDYYLCMKHNRVVELENKEEHIKENLDDSNISCSFLGQFFEIKKRVAKKSNDVSIKLVRKIKEKKNEEMWMKKYNKKIKQRENDQRLYHKQIPIGDGILNLSGVDI